MSILSNAKIVVVVGTTASGKTKLGVDLARKFHGEIVSADSRQVYKGMDVGTGKDLADYKVKTWFGKTVDIPYHLIDVVDPTEDFDLAQFQKQAYQAINNILQRGKLPIIVGGTGLYAQAIVEGYKLSSAGRDQELRRRAEKMTAEELFQKIEHQAPDFAARINFSDRQNKIRLTRYWEILKQKGEDGFRAEPTYNSLVLGVTHPRQKLKQRISQRLEKRLEQEGMIEEVKNLAHTKGMEWPRLESFGLEYKWVAYYLQNKINYQELKEDLYKDIVKMAQKQLTWLRRWQKQGRNIHWVNGRRQAGRLVKKFLKK